MELIKAHKDGFMLDPEISEKLYLWEKTVRQIKKREDELKKAIIEEMEANNIIKLDTDNLVITYVGSTDREVFDSKKFREEWTSLYDEYVKMSPVKASVRIRLK